MSAIDDFLDAAPAPHKPKSQIDSFLGDDPHERTAGDIARSIGDSAIAAGTGLVQGVKMLTDTVGADNPVSRGLGKVSDALTDLESPSRQAQKQERAAKIKAAEASGSTWEEIKAHAGAFADAPLDTTLNALGTSAPTIAAALLTGGGSAVAQTAARVAPVVIGAAQGAGNVKGQIHEAVKNKHLEAGASEAEAAQRADAAQSYSGDNAGSIALGGVLGGLAGGTGAETAARRLLGGKVASEAAEQATPGVVRSAVTGVAKEAPMEAAQGGQERYASNVALQGEGFDVPTWQGVAGQAALEGLAAAPVGGGFGAVEGLRRGAQTKPVQHQLLGTPDNPPLQPGQPSDAVEFDAAVAADALRGAQAPEQLGVVDEAQSQGNGIEFTPDPRFAQAPVYPNGAAPQSRVFGTEQAANIAIGELGLMGSHEVAPRPGGGFEIRPAGADGVSMVAPGIYEAPEAPAAAPVGVEPPSRAMGLDPAAGPLSASAALAVDSGAAGEMQQAAAATAAAQVEAAAKAPKGAKPASATATAIDADGVIDSPQNTEGIAGWSADQLRAQLRGATDPGVKRQILAELDARAAREQAAAQDLLSQPAAPAPEDLAAEAEQVAVPGQAARPTAGVPPVAPPAATPAAVVAPVAPTVAPAQVPAEAPAQVTQRIADAGAAWTRMPAAEREAVAQRTDLKPVLRKNLPKAQWDNLNADVQRKIADALQASAAPVAAAPATAPVAARRTAVRLTKEQRDAVKAQASAWAELTASERENLILQAGTQKGIFATRMAERKWENIPAETRAKLAERLQPVAQATPAVAQAADEAATSPSNDLPEPTEAQKEAGNYRKGHVRLNGHDISIENPAGSKRRPEWPALKNHYGYIRGTVGKDKDHVDVFMTDRAHEPDLPVFVVDQVNRDGAFDEHKVVMGASSEAEARRTYLGNYSKGWTGLGAITQMSQDEFRAWVRDPAMTRKPAAPAKKHSTAEAATNEGTGDTPAPGQRETPPGDAVAPAQSDATGVAGGVRAGYSPTHGRTQEPTQPDDGRGPGPGPGRASSAADDGVRGVGGALPRRSASIVGLGIAERIERAGSQALTGQQVDSPERLAELAQVFRDPRYETFRVFFVKDGKIVHATGVSSRMPGEAPMVPAGMTNEQYFAEFRANMQRTGADGYYILHNHPSGNPAPSPADRALTANLAREVPGMVAHVVINSNRYAVIDPLTAAAPGAEPDVRVKDFGKDLLLQASKPMAALGATLSSPDDLSKIGKSMQKPGWITLIGRGADGTVRAVAEAPSSILTRNYVYLGATVRRFMRQSGSRDVFAVGEAGDINSKLVRAAVASGILRDALPDAGTSLASQGLGGGEGFKVNGQVVREGAPSGDALVRQLERVVGRPAGFSQAARDQAVHSVTETAQRIREAWANGPEVIVAFDMADPVIPEAVRQADLRQRSGGASGTPNGFYHRGKVYLMASKLRTPSDVARVLFHEALGHYGLRGLFGRELGGILNQVATMRRAEVDAKIREYGLRGVSRLDRRVAAEEVLAEMAEKAPQLHFVRRAVAAIRSWLRKHVPGLGGMQLTDDEIIRNFILPARAWVEAGGVAEASGRGVVFSRTPDTQSAFEARIDTLFAGAKATTGTRVLDASDVMGLLGYPRVPLMLNERHLIDGLTNHPEMTAKAWKMVPGWLENPAMAYSDPRGSGRIIMIAPDSLAGYPVMMVVEPEAGSPARGKGGSVPAEQLLVTVYAKTSGGIPAPGFLASSGNLLYLDTKNAPGVLQRAGVQFPGQAALQRGRTKILSEKHLSGYRRSIAAPSTGQASKDSRDDGVVFSRERLDQLKSNALTEVEQALSHPGKVSLWDKTIGTMRHLAERAPAFKPVFESAQRFIDDVAMLANDAADMAPRLLPRVDTWRDLTKRPVSAADNEAVARPLFEGTLMWARDVDGRPVLVDELETKYAAMPAADKAQLMLRAGRLDPRVLAMWQGMPLAQFEAAVESRFRSQVLKPGVVWSLGELQGMFKLSDQQVSLYQEARRAIDRSIDMTARADMLRGLGAEFAGLRDQVLEQGTLAEAMELVTRTLQDAGRADPANNDRLTSLNNLVVDRYEKARDLMAQGYAPLSRFGRYTVDVVDASGERLYFGMFESMRDSNQMKLRMQSIYPGAKVTQGTMSAEAYKLFQGITPESLEMFGNMLGLDSEGSEAQDQAFQQYLQLAKNNHSALKRLIHRKGIAGYSQDVGRVLASFVYSNARQAAGGLNAGTMESAINAIPKEQGELRDVAMGLRGYIRDPQEEGQAIRGMLFAQYLGGSLASAAVNMTQPFAVTLPWLSQFGGMRRAATHLGRALKDMGTRGFQYEPDLARELRAAEDDGVVSPQEIHQLMAQARGTGSLRSGDGTRGGDVRAAVSNAWERTKVAWGQPFALAEQFNRRSTFIAAYRLAKEQGMAAPADFARRAVLETQFLYSKANKMRWARGAVGGTLMTFKTYSVSYLELMHRMWTRGGPEGKRAVAWAVVMLVLMGGAGGLPFAEDAEDLIDGAGQLMGYNLSTKQWRKQLLEDVVGRELADFVENGVSGLPGAPVDVSGRLGMGNLIPGTGLFLTKQSRERDLLEVAGPAGDLVARGFTGARKLLTGDVGGAALEVSPTAVRNAVKGADMVASGIYKDSKGYKVIDTTLPEALAKATGFQPRSVAEVQEANSFMQRSKAFYVQTSSEIKAQWAQALFEKDEAALQRARDRLAAWNKANPDQPITVRMPDIWKRVREMGKDRSERIADTAPKALRQQLRELAGQQG